MPVYLGIVFTMLNHKAWAEDNNTQDLAKAAQNPVADMITLPLQNNTNFGVGLGDEVQNVLNIQPVVPLKLSENYNLPQGWYISSAPIITANWKADSGDQWTVPFGGGVGKIFRIGKQPVNAQAQAFYNVEIPDNGPDWTLRL
ncbi:MAG: hypothetical protein V2I40_12890 [Desulfobacteraceae bacterium]|nr:hypothetical protein [Desulfobacteraceae bacterium]